MARKRPCKPWALYTGELIAGTIARAAYGLDGACNAIGGGGCPVRSIAIGGCPIAYSPDNRRGGIVRGCPTMAGVARGLWYALDAAPVAYTLLLTRGGCMPWTLPRAAPGQSKAPGQFRGQLLFVGGCMIDRGGGLRVAGCISHYVHWFTTQVIA